MDLVKGFSVFAVETFLDILEVINLDQLLQIHLKLDQISLSQVTGSLLDSLTHSVPELFGLPVDDFSFVEGCLERVQGMGG